MVQANHIHVSEQGAQAVDTPTITGPSKRLPVINRVAPELSLGAEVVRRHAGGKARPALLVQQEQLRVGPHVARVGRDEEGEVTDQAHALGMGMLLETFPLTDQQELCKADSIDLARQISPRLSQGCGFALDQICW